MQCSKLNQQNYGIYSKASCAFGCTNSIANLPKTEIKQYVLNGEKDFFCGPVSIANGILRISEKFPNLTEGYKNTTEFLKDLALNLKTDTNGTTLENICEGLESFVLKKGYTPIIEAKGFRPINSKYSKGIIPDLPWIKNKIKNSDLVIINSGIYDKDLKRSYGHYVLAKSFDFNGFGYSKDTLGILDSDSRLKGEIYIHPEKLTEGTFKHNIKTDNESVLTNNAKGFYTYPTYGRVCDITDKLNYVINAVLSLKIQWYKINQLIVGGILGEMSISYKIWIYNLEK